MIEFVVQKCSTSDTNLCERMLCKLAHSSTEGHNLVNSFQSMEIFLYPLFPKQFSATVKHTDTAKCTTKTSCLPHTVKVRKEF